jgi:hypothetical protein
MRGIPMLHCPPNFHDGLYVPRDRLYPQLDAWIDNPDDPKRVRVLIGPPGIGKTWTLKDYAHHLDELGTRRQVPVVGKVYLPDFFATGHPPAALGTWLERLYIDVRRKFPVFPGVFIPLADSTQAINDLVRDLAGITAAIGLVLIADGYDELTTEERLQADQRMLGPFVSHNCARLLVAYRSECKFENFILRQAKGSGADIFLEPFDDDADVKMQYRKWLTHEGLTDFDAWWPGCQQWMNNLLYYQWNHPYANASLLCKAFIAFDQPLKPLTAADLHNTIEEIIVRAPHHPALSPDDFMLLVRIAVEIKSDSWKNSELNNLVPGGSIAIIKRITPLIERGVIESIENPHRYRIVAGLLELLRDFACL